MPVAKPRRPSVSARARFEAPLRVTKCAVHGPQMSRSENPSHVIASAIRSARSASALVRRPASAAPFTPTVAHRSSGRSGLPSGVVGVSAPSGVVGEC